MSSDKFFYPNPESDEKFTIEERYGKLTLYWYDSVKQVSRPIVIVQSPLYVCLPLIDKTDGGGWFEEHREKIYGYPHFGWMRAFDVKTTFKNNDKTFTDVEIDEIYLRSIAKNFHKFKNQLLGKFA